MVSHAAEVRGLQRSHQTPLILTLRKYNEGLLFSVLWYCSLSVSVSSSPDDCALLIELSYPSRVTPEVMLG